MNRACCSLQNAVPEAGIHLHPPLTHIVHTAFLWRISAGTRLFGCTCARIREGSSFASVFLRVRAGSINTRC